MSRKETDLGILVRLTSEMTGLSSLMLVKSQEYSAAVQERAPTGEIAGLKNELVLIRAKVASKRAELHKFKETGIG